MISPDELKEISTKTGVYLFKGPADDSSQSKILYVGKAKNLRVRVRQYFIGDGDGRPFVEFIRKKTAFIETIVVATEQDALLLENELIKKYRPPYNIHLRDDKRYLSLRLDLSHEWPRIEVVRKIKKDKAIYLGPFSSALRLRETLNIMQKIFPLRTCQDSKLYNRSRPCLEYDIKRCCAPCVNYVEKAEYGRLVDSAMMFLKGETGELVQKLNERMATMVEAENFEEAARLRDQISAVQNTVADHQSIMGQKQFQKGIDQDAIGLALKDKRAVIFVLFVRNGIVWDQRSFEFTQLPIDSSELLAQFLSQYYSGDVYMPHEVLVPEPVEVLSLGKRLKILSPRSREKRGFLDIAQQNAEESLRSKVEKSERLSAIVESFQAKVGLSRRPSKMDCFDISHHQGSDVVASVVRFSEGLPDKNFYRKMKLKAQQVDDFASMKEALSRRYKDAEDLPDLIVVDGGKGQLNAAYAALESLELQDRVEIVSLAKARSNVEVIDPLNPKNRERVFKLHQKNPILLKEESPEELLLTYIRDEAHRFAISFHRKKKVENLSFSVLDEIKGITPRLKLKLLKNFGSVDGIKQADDLDLLKVVKPSVLKMIRESLD